MKNPSALALRGRFRRRGGSRGRGGARRACRSMRGGAKRRRQLGTGGGREEAREGESESEARQQVGKKGHEQVGVLVVGVLASSTAGEGASIGRHGHGMAPVAMVGPVEEGKNRISHKPPGSSFCNFKKVQQQKKQFNWGL